jgi:uncharacterized membrane protein YidH (DUF202 family)
MINIATLVDRALRAAGIPIDGVSIGTPETDRAQWVVKFQAAATPAQRTQAASLLTTVAIDTAADNAAKFADSSRGKDVLAIIALIVRARGISAWNALTLQQKKDATLAEADVWITIRDFIETNL